ncbi:hypothetical protein [Ralstonia solanacearum]|uniref:hypothetical protein n=1 Tax=Ralstonia solanacearum TaxID=305 RepID=UPI0001D95FD6|nr:hypothetical protein [Ralstonia solanacearum]CBJ35633.1 conserved hypothethical protein [Ralstonia solanacearum PSI07]
MNDELKKAVEKSKAAMQTAHPEERAAFKALLLSNPNYFGNLAESVFTPVLPIAGNTHYEELACVGFHPQQDRIEAVVYIYQPSGYGTDICGAGTPEYVRFYLSADNGATWQDQGMTAFQAHNIPAGTEGGKRLEYAVSLAAYPARKLCFVNPVIMVRAILSWNNPPPPNQPNWTPVWGNVRDANILVEPRRFIIPYEIFEIAKAKIPPHVNEIIDLETAIPTTSKALGPGELATLYKGKGVPVQRFAYKELAAFTSSATTLSAEAFLALHPGISIDPSIIGALFPKTDGDTSYEQLTCIGLDPNAPDQLVGVIQVKKSAGYSGGPCTQGSHEYVTFWADFDGDGVVETCLGTASVRVYDLPAIPSGGVCYAVRLPVDLGPYRQPCHQGPKVVLIRAILSWNSAAPCANPNYVPTWGNREETLVNIAPTEQQPAGYMAILGGIPVSMISNNLGDPNRGLTTPDAVFATNNLPPDAYKRLCPFAGRVSAQGAPIVGYTYVVEVSQDGSVWTPVLTDLDVTDQFGNVSTHKANPTTKRFSYLDFTSNVNGLLAEWDTTGDALWHVRLSIFDGAGTPQGTDTHLIQLDNTAPDVSIVITTGTGDCGKFPIGTILSGTFVARDANMGGYSLGVAPAVNPPGVGVPSPSSGVVNTAPAPGDSWTLDTSGMEACGYIIEVTAHDRAIVNSQAVGHYVSQSAGFCLVAPEQA